MRLTNIVIMIAMILVAPSLFIGSELSNGEKISPFPEEDSEPYSSVSYDGMQLMVRDTQKEDIDFLRSHEGVARADQDFNPNIEGSGTGLKPPTDSEWNTIGSSFNIIDGVTSSSPSALNTSKYNNGSIHFPPIGNQGSEGSCVSWSIGYYTKTFQEAKEHGWDLSGATYGGSYPGEPSSSYHDKIMSPDFLYHQTNNGVDGGSYYSDAIFMTQRTGISSWKEMPYDDDNHTSWPAENAWREAPQYRTMKNSTYYMYTQNNASITNLKTWIDGDQLATISINAYRYSSLSNELWNNTVACGTGRNHANTIVGYNNNFGPYTENGVSTTGAFLVANSWGKGWTGDTNSDGMYWISYECMRLKVQYVYLMADRIDYEPKAVALFNLSHSIRDECIVTLGIGSTSSPVDTKQRFDNAYYDGGSHPFPSNLMAFDITDFQASVSTFTGYNYFLRVEDGGTSTTGSIRSFSIELYDNFSAGYSMRFSSDDPVVNTINGGTVYAELTVTDTAPPSIISDLTVTSTTTGDPLNFTVVISDNGLMDRVFVEYRYGSGLVSNTSMNEGPSDTWFLNITTQDTLDNITYRFLANDTGNNWNISSPKVITISDNDAPLISPTIPLKATTGDPFTATLEVMDNIDIDEVVMEHWYDQDNHTNTTMSHSSGNNWSHTLSVEDRLGSLHMVFKADDPSGNLAMTVQYNFAIEDNDLPVLELDNSDLASTTGEEFTLSAEITDNIDVSSVWVAYENGDGFSGNTTMILTSPDTWELDLFTPDSTEDLSYIFHFNDTSDNWNSTTPNSMIISDNDLPIFSLDLSPSSGTTGEEFIFQVDIFDNIQVEWAYLEYWYGTDIHVNVSLTGPSPYSHQITIQENSTDPLNYIFHGVDPSSNWNQTDPVSVMIIDNDLPGAWTDTTPVNGTTGDMFIFDVSLFDNIGIDEVFVEYWFNEAAHQNSSMTYSGTFSYSIEIPDNSTGYLHYFFVARDRSGNWNTTGTFDIGIIDNDIPIFTGDGTQLTGTTGNHFTFNISGIDNIEIASVHVEYWFGTGGVNNISMSGNGNYLHQILIPYNSTDELHYFFSIADPSDNWNRTQEVQITIFDDDHPYLISDDTSTSGTTGDPFQFIADIQDNIEVVEVWLRYCYGEGEWTNVTMEENDLFTHSLILPEDSLDNLSYMFIFRDSSENWNQTNIRTIQILDNDLPIFWMDNSPSNTTTGSDFVVSVEIIDNIGLFDVILEYWFGDGGEHNEISMIPSGSSFSCDIPIPTDSIDELHYLVKTNDTSGLKNSTATRIVHIFDNIPPEIDTVEDITIYLGSEINIDIIAGDNIGILSYSWDGVPVEVSGPNLIFTPAEIGLMIITVTIADEAGNTAGTDLTITILSSSHDRDEDGIPDLVEDEIGLNRNDPTDALEDDDEDGLTNLEEYRNGTSIDDPDTDGDGMPDKWEIDNELDPVISSAADDTDKDGISDLNEYLGDTNPLVTDFQKVDDTANDEGNEILILIAASIAALVLIIIVISLFLIIRKVRKNRIHVQDEEVVSWD